MAIFRVEKNKDYSTIHNGFLKDNRLSLKAKGLLAYFLSRPDDWDFYSNEILKHCKDGKDSLGSAIKELEIAGYIQRDFKRNTGGKFSGGYDYVVYEIPNPPKEENPISEKPKPENPNSENPPLLNTESGLSTESLPSIKLSSSSKELSNKEVYNCYEQSGFGLLNATLIEMIDIDVQMFGKEWVIDAMKEAVKQNRYKLNYVEGILRNWKADGRNPKQKKEDKASGGNRRADKKGGTSGPSKETERLEEYARQQGIDIDNLKDIECDF